MEENGGGRDPEIGPVDEPQPLLRTKKPGRQGSAAAAAAAGVPPWAWLALAVVALPLFIGLLTVFHHEDGAKVIAQKVSGVGSYLWSQGGLNASYLNSTLFTLQGQLAAIQGDLGNLRSGMTTLRMASNLTTKRFNNLREDLRELEAEILSLNETLREQQVMVEPRDHPHLQYVLENFDQNMPLNYDLVIFHGKSRREYAEKAAKNVALHRKVYYHALDGDNGNGDFYNQLLKSRTKFWDLIKAENVLTFQTDAVLCSGSDRTIRDFEHMGYIGCAYDRTAGKDSTASKVWWFNQPFWGNGGVTFHKRSAALACIDSQPKIAAKYPEDVFFSGCVDRGMGRHAETGSHLSEFCTTLGEITSFVGKSFAAHKPREVMTEKTGVDLFIRYCPEVKAIM